MHPFNNYFCFGFVTLNPKLLWTTRHSLTQLPVRLGSELPSEGFALMRTKLDDSSSLCDGKPKLSLLLALPSPNSSEYLERPSLKFRGKEEKTSEFKSVLLSSSESDCNKNKNFCEHLQLEFRFNLSLKSSSKPD